MRGLSGGFGEDFTRGSRPLLEEWVQVACSPTALVANRMHDNSGVGATVTKDTLSSASVTRARGWQRTQLHQENGYSPTENCLSYIIKEGKFTLNFFPARRGFHCISLTAKVNGPGIPCWGWGEFK